LDPNLFVFTGWAGSAVDNGRVSDPNQPFTSVLMDANDSLVALYRTTLATLVVDANIGEEATQQGTEAFPLARIQDAMTLAVDGTSVLVRSGVYQEHIDFQGKAVQLIGADPNQAETSVYPVIMADDAGPVVRFSKKESSDSLLMGFILLGGQGGIVCEQSSPTILNCVVAGTQIHDPNQGAVHLVNSQAFLSHLTITDNLCPLQGAGLVMENSQCVITNSIVWNNFSRAVRASDEDRSLIHYSNIEGGWTSGDLTQADLGIIARWPLFVSSGKWQVPEDDPNTLVFVPGDYHLRSQAGHWDTTSQIWITDSQTSPSINAGDPVSPVGMEPMPHGTRINQGAFGATSQASLSTQ
ncbi:MAG: right-handed parallel beta-helix repeat-containing protein, partial [Phycisphaerae bacterium]|nr:right-handed parallel beta-helix repeat-containing protein [Phycisphaerae bacterium]